MQAAQEQLLQPRELSEPEGKAGIVAQRTQIAQVVGDALELQIQRPQPRRPRGNLDLSDSLDGLTIRPGEGHSRVPRDARCEPVPFQYRKLSEALLDAFVNVTQAL